nr:Myb family transcription factor APL [Ipomoea batatas]
MQCENEYGDSVLVLSTDAKPRLKWTQYLHERFVEAVNQLGGADRSNEENIRARRRWLEEDKKLIKMVALLYLVSDAQLSDGGLFPEELWQWAAAEERGRPVGRRQWAELVSAEQLGNGEGAEMDWAAALG